MDLKELKEELKTINNQLDTLIFEKFFNNNYKFDDIKILEDLENSDIIDNDINDEKKFEIYSRLLSESGIEDELQSIKEEIENFIEEFENGDSRRDHYIETMQEFLNNLDIENNIETLSDYNSLLELISKAKKDLMVEFNIKNKQINDNKIISFILNNNITNNDNITSNDKNTNNKNKELERKIIKFFEDYLFIF